MDLFEKFFGRKKEKRTPAGTNIVNYDHIGTRPSGIGPAPAEWMEERSQYYEEWFGPIDYVSHEMVPMVPHIDVFVCKPHPAKGRDFYTLVTSGMSDMAMNAPRGVPREQLRVELLVCVPRERIESRAAGDDLWEARYLYQLATIPHSCRTWFGPFHTITNGQPPAPLTEGSVLTTALLMPPLYECDEVQKGITIGSHRVSFLWVVPISDAECELKLNQGTEALLDLFDSQRHPQVLDIMRASYV